MSLQYQTDDEQTADEPTEHEAEAARPSLPLYTVILIASIGAVFAAQMFVGLDPSIELAGFVKPAFLGNHEYWRILTGAATHGSLLHVGMNCYAFTISGK